ncbi:MAG: prepilin-type N-terminal cleavage/methylation domain-containing protein [Candidatus Paceibacterota bacterium]|jgi:prepilin-type N-terminal cleavage/methylation domain-containing protein
MKNKFLKTKKGFTIIETMIAVSLFLVIVMIGMGALLNANLVHRKSQDMRSIIDNLSFIMEEMSRNLRTGYNYHCIDDGFVTKVDLNSCTSDGKGISFKSSSGAQWVYAIFQDGNISSIKKSVDGGATFTTLTSSEVMIDTSSSFYVTGAELGDGKQPFVLIRLVGKITYKNIDTPFSLQTSVSQRLIDTGVSSNPN